MYITGPSPMSVLEVAQASTGIGQVRILKQPLGPLSQHHCVLRLSFCIVHLHMQAFNVSVKASQSSSFIGGLGRLLDKGINRLISGDLPPSGPPSGGSEQADLYGRQHSKNSDPGSPSVRVFAAYSASLLVQIVTQVEILPIPRTTQH